MKKLKLAFSWRQEKRTKALKEENKNHMETKNDFQKQKADDFLALHRSSEILILPNVWDAASTKIFELENYKAIGTTSAGISAMMGYPDGQELKFEDALQINNRIINCTDLPVNIDLEAGYSESVAGVVANARRVLECGAAGINLEDSVGANSDYSTSTLYDINFQCEKISAIREMAINEGVHLVINARTDVFLVSHESTNKINQAIERANCYIKAGADCVFVPDMGDFSKSTIITLVNEIDGPINIIAGANIPPINELEKIGVARISFGPRMMRVTFDLIRSIAKEIKQKGTYSKMSSCKITYSEVNNWFKKSKNN